MNWTDCLIRPYFLFLFTRQTSVASYGAFAMTKSIIKPGIINVFSTLNTCLLSTIKLGVF